MRLEPISFKCDNNANVLPVGVVVIGRNEGQMLHKALASAQISRFSVLYVDSGSTDNSLKIAESLGVRAYELDDSRPFSPARARTEGVARLTELWPEIQYIQFLDGDCTLSMDWIETAAQYLRQNKSAGIVCGRLSERHPERSIYNRLASMKWNVPAGEVDDCGGIFMIKRSVYERIGGFNIQLLTGEEAALCAKVRSAGHKIVRIDAEMATHDANQIKFSDWWRRMVWGGYGIALAYEELKNKLPHKQQRDMRSTLFWAAGVPIAGFFGLVGILWSAWFGILFLFSLFTYIVLLIKIFRDRQKTGDSTGDAMLYALFCILSKFGGMVGYASYWANPLLRNKRPDPHANIE
jgi:GT2 family glycosyltransferase